MICPVCRAQIGRYAWQPFNVSGGLSIAWTCPNGHAGQTNGVDMILPPIGRPPTGLPPLSPVDFCQH